jgi:hypothetical protein
MLKRRYFLKLLTSAAMAIVMVAWAKSHAAASSDAAVATDGHEFTTAGYEYAIVAAECPQLAPGLTCLDILRDTLDRYCDGMVAYGMVGYGANYEGANTDGWPAQFTFVNSVAVWSGVLDQRQAAAVML